MRLREALIVASALLAAGGAFVAAAFYGIFEGYPSLYLGLLAVSLVVGVLAYRGTVDADLRGPSSAILAGSVVYWALGGSMLPEWANGVVLLIVPIVLAGAVTQLSRRRYQPISDR